MKFLRSLGFKNFIVVRQSDCVCVAVDTPSHIFQHVHVYPKYWHTAGVRKFESNEPRRVQPVITVHVVYSWQACLHLKLSSFSVELNSCHKKCIHFTQAIHCIHFTMYTQYIRIQDFYRWLKHLIVLKFKAKSMNPLPSLMLMCIKHCHKEFQTNAPHESQSSPSPKLQLLFWQFIIAE